MPSDSFRPVTLLQVKGVLVSASLFFRKSLHSTVSKCQNCFLAADPSPRLLILASPKPQLQLQFFKSSIGWAILIVPAQLRSDLTVDELPLMHNIQHDRNVPHFISPSLSSF